MLLLALLACRPPGARIDGVSYESLQEALDAASADDVVQVESGVHVGSFQAPVRVTLVGEPGAVLDGEGRRVLWAADSIAVEDLTLRGAFADEGAAIWSDGDVRITGSEVYVDYTDAIRTPGLLTIEDSLVRSERVLATFPLGGLEVVGSEIPPPLSVVRGTLRVTDTTVVGGDDSPLFFGEGRAVLRRVSSERSLSVSARAIEADEVSGRRVSLWSDQALEARNIEAVEVLWLSGQIVEASSLSAPELSAIGYRWIDARDVSGDMVQVTSDGLVFVEDLTFTQQGSVSGDGRVDEVFADSTHPALLLGLGVSASGIVLRGSESASLQALSGATVDSALVIDEGSSEVGPCLRAGNNSTIDAMTFIGCGTHPVELSGSLAMSRTIFASDLPLAFQDLDDAGFAGKSFEDVYAWPEPVGNSPVEALDLGVSAEEPGRLLAYGAFIGDAGDVVESLYLNLGMGPP